MSWYTKTMMTVKDAKNIYKDLCTQIKSLPNVNTVYIWGSFKDHINNPSYIIRDIDIIAKTSFHSEDLIAIDSGRYSPLTMKTSMLEDEGFSPKAVEFTKKYTSIQYNVDHWAISKDKKLLHWGCIPESKEEWIDLHTQAETMAHKETGIKRKDLTKHANKKRTEWKMIYDTFLKQTLSETDGWFISSDDVSTVLKKAIII